MKVSPEEAGTASSGTAESFLKVTHLASGNDILVVYERENENLGM